MKIIYNSIIPFKGFSAINLFGVVFARKEFKGRITPTTMRHETIHTVQMRELGYIGFYIIYIVEWLVRLCLTPKSAYRNISFEQEAYSRQGDVKYLDNRKCFAQWRKIN